MSKPARRRLLLTAAFLAAIALTFVFGFRAGRHVRLIRWQNEPIRGWMSVPFIAHTHHIQPDVLYRAIGIAPADSAESPDRRPLRRIARETNRPLDQIIHSLDTAIGSARAVTPGDPARH